MRHAINANVVRWGLPLYSDQQAATLPAFIPLKVESKRVAEASAVIELPLGQHTLTVSGQRPIPKDAPDSFMGSLNDPHRLHLARHRPHGHACRHRDCVGQSDRLLVKISLILLPKRSTQRGRATPTHVLTAYGRAEVINNRSRYESLYYPPRSLLSPSQCGF